MYRNGTWDDYPTDAEIGFIMQTEALSDERTEEVTNISGMEWQTSQGCEVKDVYDYDTAETRRTMDWYRGGIRMAASDRAWFCVNLDGAYDAFSGKVVCDSEAADNANLQFAVFGDGKLLYESKSIRKASEAAEFSVDLTGVRVLTAASSNTGGWDGSCLWLLGAELTGAPEKQEANAGRLSELVAVDTVESYSESGLFTDAYGELHDGRIEMNAGAGARILYNLNGRYNSISLVAASGEKTALDAKTTITFYGDGEMLYQLEDFDKRSGQKELFIDLTGMTTLEIAAESETEDSRIYLTDDRLIGE